MRNRLAGLAAGMLLVGACGASWDVAQTVEDMPKLPETPSGWTMVSGFGGSGSQFTVDTGVEFGDGDVVVNGACNGSGTLVVMILPAASGDSGVGPSAVIPCGDLDAPAVRYELVGMSIPKNATVRATVVEGPGTTRHATFQVLVEERQPS
jgi:hypothetical protein